MSKPEFQLVFSEGAAEFLMRLPKRHQRRVVALARQLADHPSLRSDYWLADDSGRKMEHLMVEDFVFAYWLDHSVRELRITDIDDAS